MNKLLGRLSIRSSSSSKSSSSKPPAKAIVHKLPDDVDPRRLGVSLEHLKSLPVDSKASFSDACTYVKSQTVGLEGYRSYARYLYENPATHHLVSLDATVFVSYAWSGGFGATMNALCSHFGEANLGKTFVWMDFAVVDQHEAAVSDFDFNHWAETFQGNLQRIGRAVLVLSPGKNPIATRRSWCCFEWLSIVRSGIPFDYCVNPGDVTALISDFKQGMIVSEFHEIFSHINVEKSEAFKKSDQEAILALLRKVGVKEVNDVVMLSLKKWMLSVADRALESDVKEDTEEMSKVYNSLACLHQSLSDFTSALPLFYRAVECSRKVANNERNVAAKLNNLGMLLSSLGKHSEAQQALEESIALARSKSDDVQLAISLNNLAGLKRQLDKFGEVEPLLRQAITINVKLFAAKWPELDGWAKRISAIVNREQVVPAVPEGEFPKGKGLGDLGIDLNNLAQVLRELGSYDQAEAVAREATRITKQDRGDDHAEYALVLNNLAGILQDTGQLEEAERLFEEALAIRRKVLGDNHLEVAQSWNDIAALLQDQGRFPEAEANYRKVLAVRQHVLGEEHLQVSVTLNDLGLTLKRQKRLNEAETLYKQAIAMNKKTTGGENAHYAIALNNLAGLLWDLGKLQEAEPLYRESLAVKEKLSADHPSLGSGYNNLALLLMELGKRDEGREMGLKAVAFCERVLGKDYPTTKQIRANWVA